MFLGKRQAVYAYAGPTPMMPDGQMGMMGMPMGTPEVMGYAQPGVVPGTPGMPGMEAVGFTTSGVTDTMHATHTELTVPGCPPVHYGHTEFEVRPRELVHVVRKGETVYKIAKRYGLDWREVAGYNHLGNPNLIYPGQRLFIPVR